MPAKVKKGQQKRLSEKDAAAYERGRIDTMDAHGIIHGEAATAFLAQMERERTPEELAAHEKHMQECEEVYRSSEAKREGERTCGICCRKFGNLPALIAHLTSKNDCGDRLASAPSSKSKKGKRT